MAEQPRAKAWVVLLHRSGGGTLSQAAAMTAAAASLGISVTVVWFGEALEALVSGRLEDEPEHGPASAAALFAGAREAGLARFLACSASAVDQKSGVESVRASVDEIVGWPTVVSLIRGAEKAFVW